MTDVRRRRLRAFVSTIVLAAVMHAPEARATSTGVIEFAGPLSLSGCPGGGFGAPAVAGPVTGTGPNLTAETCTFAFGTAVCLSATANPNKLGMAPASVGACSITAGGTSTGFCGLSHGTGGGSFTDAAGATFAVPTFGWTEIAGVLVITGSVVRGSQAGLLYAVGQLSPVPIGGGSCLVGSGSLFTLVGSGSFAVA